MCGIVGYFGGMQTDQMQALANDMCQTIIHRGPDDQGIHYADAAGTPGFIGMRRLSIIDLDTGQQPIHNEDESIWVVFNGEIYNYKELNEELSGLGHTFYTSGDAECIVHAYETWGDDFANHLRGMFSIALWDDKRKRLVLARDPIGKKPLFYTEQNGQLAFGSELKSLLQIPGFDTALCDEALRSYVILNYVPNPLSIFESVKKLRPGHILTWEQGKLEEHRYWQLDYTPKSKRSDAELFEELDEIMNEAVRIRLRSDVPFGAFLSGGLDSSLVTALMAKHLDKPFTCFTIGFNEAAYSEVDDARIVTDHFGIKHEVLVVDAEAASVFDKLVWHLDEPFADTSALPTYIVSKLAASSVKMVLSGDGGDEAFVGYDRYKKYQTLVDWKARAPWLAPKLASLGGSILPGKLGLRMRWVGERLAQDYPGDYLSGVAVTAPPIADRLLKQSIHSTSDYGVVTDSFSMNPEMSLMDRVVAGDVNSYLTDDICVKVDRMSMANSLEVRSPILDKEVMQFAAKLPMHLKLNDGTGKVLLRQLCKKYLPPQLLNKPKQGFGIPLAEWLRGDLREKMWDTLNQQSIKERGMFNVAFAKKMMEQHETGAVDNSEQLWVVLMAETWAQRFIDA